MVNMAYSYEKKKAIDKMLKDYHSRVDDWETLKIKINNYINRKIQKENKRTEKILDKIEYGK